MSDPLINRIAESGLITLKPEEWLPKEHPVAFDLQPYLFQGLILKEKDFRESMKSLDWSQYKDKMICVFCSADAIIPHWAYMLVAAHASPYVSALFYGTPLQWMNAKVLDYIESMDVSPFTDQRIVIKGCGDAFEAGPEIYTALTARLLPVAKSIMYGEPCSTVPVYKRPR